MAMRSKASFSFLRSVGWQFKSRQVKKFALLLMVLERHQSIPESLLYLERVQQKESLATTGWISANIYVVILYHHVCKIKTLDGQKRSIP
jgi:hypothetical protein